ncbi:MAG: hypothetical protein AB7J13_04685 [Pyrinomonadaceae bacterium]
MKFPLFLLVVSFSFLVSAPSLNGQVKLKAEEIIQKHLASIAPAEKLASVKSFVAVGEVKVEYVTQKNQAAEGRIVIASEGRKMFLGMQLNAADYPQEKFVFDGKKLSVSLVRAGNRSVLGNFVQSNGAIITQGMFAGPLATSWAFLSSGEPDYKVSTAGNKKIDGKETYAIRFSPKGSIDVDVTMYFDQVTFHHVRTEYKRTSSASIGRTIDESARQNETRLRLTEDFSDFKEFEGLTVPHTYKITYSISGASSTEILYTSKFSEFAINQALAPASFATDN